MCAVAATFDHPLENAHVFAETGPEVRSVRPLAEKIHMKDAGHVFDGLAHLEPVGKIVAHIVTTEGEHRHGIAAHLPDGAGGGSGGLGPHCRPEINAVHPVEGLENERHRRRTSSAKEDRTHRNTRRVFPIGINDRAVPRGSREAAIRVAAEDRFAVRIFAPRCPILPQPVHKVGRWLGRHSLPPHIAVIGEADISEDGVASDGVHRDRIAGA